jgi:hypothetical protein
MGTLTLQQQENPLELLPRDAAQQSQKILRDSVLPLHRDEALVGQFVGSSFNFFPVHLCDPLQDRIGQQPRSRLELSRFAADAFACCGADGRGDLS